MGFRMIAPKRVRKVKTQNGQEVLRRLEEYLKGDFEEPIQILCGFWKDQQEAITYQELRQAVINGVIDQEILRLWRQDYSVLIAGKFGDLWRDAVTAGSSGQPILDGVTLHFNAQASGVLNWINKRGAEFVTASTQEQKDAIAALLTKKMRDNHTVDELSRFIRPCIGLTERDAKAAARFYDSIVATLKKDHPRMKLENIQKRALDAAQKYAERKHRQRAMTIAQTESAFAYNRGADEGVRQAQAQGFLGKTIKRWSTSGDDAVCSICQALEGMELDMDKPFPFKGKNLFPGQDLLPPAHPRCACAIEYIEIEPPKFSDTPQMEVDITQAEPFHEYTTSEIEDIAKQTEEIASKHVSVPSKWSGNMLIKDEGIQNSDGHVTYYGKMWNCDILTKHETSPAVILHEQLHARSISYFGSEEYFQYGNIEEAAVQFMTEEICRKENIKIVSSDYDDLVNTLREIGRRIGYSTDYEFAKDLIEKPVIERLNWLSDKLYAILGNDPTATLEEYQKLSELLDLLY